MANDPGLSADTQTYMEAIAGDGGVHDPSAVFWLSPDIELTGSVSGIGKADPGVNNAVEVSFHAKPNGTLPAGSESITIELWVANPSLAMAPNNAASTKHIDSIGMPLPSAGGAQTFTFNWVPPSGVAASDPQAPGHKCLIARAYGDPAIPSTMSFFAPQDPHVAQHNICIVPCGGPGAAQKPAGCGVDVTTLNPDARRQRLKLRAQLDVDPAKRVRGIALKYLEKTPGFRRLAPKPPRGFGFTFEGVTAKAAAPGKAGRAPAYEAVVAADPGEVIRFQFAADLRGGKLGDAHIFHLTQAGADGRMHGGLTVAVLAI
jgi:hypothetical protein